MPTPGRNPYIPAGNKQFFSIRNQFLKMVSKVFRMQEVIEIGLKASEELDSGIGRTTNIFQERGISVCRKTLL